MSFAYYGCVLVLLKFVVKKTLTR